MSSGTDDGSPLALVDVEVDGVPGCTVRIAGGTVVAVGPDMRPAPDDTPMHGAGGALLPGLHDHHVHLRSLAAARASVMCGPPAVRDVPGLRRALRAAMPRRGWIRGVGYHETVAGPLDRAGLDAVRADVPVRIQHRSGMTWTVNSAGVAALGLATAAHPGIGRDADGTPTGVLVRADDWLAEVLPAAPPDLAPVGALLAGYGVTGATDATVTNDTASAATLGGAQEAGALPQRVHLLGHPDLTLPRGAPRLTVGPVKVVLDEVDLPPLDDLGAVVAQARAAGRGVAIHAVTRATLALAVAVLRSERTHPDDRIEHASVCPPELADVLATLGVTVVTQPNFVTERGARYRAEVDADDLPWLYPARLLLDRGVPVAFGTDAPFGDPDPWAAIAAAVRRETGDGAPLGPDQRIDATTALDAFLTPLASPGGPPRRVAVGAPADLCLLDAPLADALADPRADRVVATVVAGRRVFART